jgi:hypothetical protein
VIFGGVSSSTANFATNKQTQLMNNSKVEGKFILRASANLSSEVQATDFASSGWSALAYLADSGPTFGPAVLL